MKMIRFAPDRTARACAACKKTPVVVLVVADGWLCSRCATRKPKRETARAA